jgi:hypothetical protein
LTGSAGWVQYFAYVLDVLPVIHVADFVPFQACVKLKLREKLTRSECAK